MIRVEMVAKKTNSSENGCEKLIIDKEVFEIDCKPKDLGESNPTLYKTMKTHLMEYVYLNPLEDEYGIIFHKNLYGENKK